MRFGGSITDSSGNPRASFHAVGTITRSKFGVMAELEQDAGSMMIGGDVAIDIEVEAIRSQDTR